MCGIAGELSFGAPVDERSVAAMTGALVHRGPDDAGLYVDGQIGLGHRRLSIIDLSPAGRNPLWSFDGTMAIVFNGELYNYRELRQQLIAAGCRFRSETDTEVALHAVQCWGLAKALSTFIGMFAFAIWDTRTRSLVLARDRAGIKPLYFSIDEQRLLFASELKALYAHPGYRKALNRTGLAQFFVLGYTIDSTTIFERTHRVPAAHFMRIESDGRTSTECYWTLDDVERGSFRGSFEDAAARLEELAEDAFRLRLVSDVPVGVFLSGGIDSTFLAAILKRRLDADLLHLTIGFREPRFDESPAAREVARDLGIRHEVSYADAPDAAAALRRFTEIYDEPFGDSSGIPTAMLSAEARKHVKVALSADGGDEQFCGYESYTSYARRYGQFTTVPRGLRTWLRAVVARLPYEQVLSVVAGAARDGNRRLVSSAEKGIELLAANGPGDVLRIMNEKGWSTSEVGNLIGDHGDPFAGTALCADYGDASLIDRMMRTDYAVFMRDDVLAKVDRASMAASLECRDPFLDHRLAEFSYSLPLSFHYQNGEHKRLLKHVLKKWISPAVLQLPKRGFMIPLAEWMRGPWRPLVDEYLSAESVRRVGVLDERVVSREVTRFYSRNGVGAERVQLLLNFQMWADRWYRDGAAA